MNTHLGRQLSELGSLSSLEVQTASSFQVLFSPWQEGGLAVSVARTRFSPQLEVQS